MPLEADGGVQKSKLSIQLKPCLCLWPTRQQEILQVISMAPIELLPSLAQSGSASGLGPEGRRIKSYMTDQILDLMGNVVSLSGL